MFKYSHLVDESELELKYASQFFCLNDIFLLIKYNLQGVSNFGKLLTKNEITKESK